MRSESGITALILAVVHIRMNKSRPAWDSMRGWILIDGEEEIPSIDLDLYNLYRQFGHGMNHRALGRLVRKTDSHRASVRVKIAGYKPLKAQIFFKPSGSLMIVFPRHRDTRRRRLMVFRMGEISGKDRSEIGSELVEIFETHLAGLRTFTMEKIVRIRESGLHGRLKPGGRRP
jgi:hypothetical protein